MKMISAIINPYKLEQVRSTLADIGVGGITVTEVKGFGRQKGHTEHYHGAEYQIDFVPKIKLELVVDERRTETVVEALLKSAYSGKLGDGKLFVSTVGQTVRIRTGEEGVEAV